MNSNEPPLIIFALFPILFTGMWCFACWKLSQLGGWQKLSQIYRVENVPSGRCFRMQSGKFGWVNYSGCLSICPTVDGIYLSILFLFRIGHPPLFIPWSHVRNAELKKVLWLKYMRFDVSNPSIATIQLPKKVFDARRQNALKN